MKTQVSENQATIIFKGTYNGILDKPTWHNLVEGEAYPKGMTPTQCKIVNSMLRGRRFLHHMLTEGDFTAKVELTHWGHVFITVEKDDPTSLEIICSGYHRFFGISRRGKITDYHRERTSKK